MLVLIIRNRGVWIIAGIDRQKQGCMAGINWWKQGCLFLELISRKWYSDIIAGIDYQK